MSGRDPPDFAAARDHVVREVVRFARTLRANGASVPANAALTATAALSELGLRDRDRTEVAMRATLLTDPRDEETFDTHFPTFWYRLRTGLEATATVDELDPDATGSSGLYPGESSDAPLADGTDGGDGERTGDGRAEVRTRRVAESNGESEAPPTLDDGTRPGTYSAAGSGEPVEGEAAPDAEGSVDPGSVRRLARALATLPGRRWRPGSGAQVDARRALRRSLSTGGVAVRLPRRRRDPRELRACVLVDVSRSVLDALDRDFLLSFLDALVDEGRGVRVFFFDTEIQEVTDAFARSEGDPAAALSRAEVSWGGGTKIGDALSALRTRWPGAVDRRTVTLVISDGLDVGDIDTLDRGMVWLSRRAAGVVWFNPLAASAAYEPTCRGMATALPYVDGLFALAGSEDVDEAARQLARHGARGPVGYEYDFREREVAG